MKGKEERALRKILILLFFAFILSGCATYKFQKSVSSGNQGYLVTYDGDPILEYTIGKEKTLPDLALAKERFKRRRSTIEYYYKQSGQIESRFKEFLWDVPAMCMDFVSGVLRWPFIAVSDYKYNHNPKYKERMDRLDQEREALEKARINSLKEKLTAYIAQDLAKEHLPQSKVVETPVTPKSPEPVVLPFAQGALPPAPPVSLAVQTQVPKKIETPKTETPVIKEPISPVLATAPAPIKTVLEPPVAVITAKPIKGYSPLTVKFSGQKSYSKNGKIVSYNWDFGDGDTSSKKNPENTYWSTVYGARNFTVTLTVKDAAGSTSSATSIIEVSTP
ncbi:MAG: PKD domain-containing protein [Candidatus Omnitrophica bacterium]|nr:PKD domain-containing protein [Candidatus Omnitrophota bacterium]